MASYTVTPTGAPAGVHKTLSGTTADAVTIGGFGQNRVEIVNRGSATIYARADGTVAVAAADNTIAILPTGSFEFAAAAGLVVSVVGNGDAYSVHAIPAGAS